MPTLFNTCSNEFTFYNIQHCFEEIKLKLQEIAEEQDSLDKGLEYDLILTNLDFIKLLDLKNKDKKEALTNRTYFGPNLIEHEFICNVTFSPDMIHFKGDTETDPPIKFYELFAKKFKVAGSGVYVSNPDASAGEIIVTELGLLDIKHMTYSAYQAMYFRDDYYSQLLEDAEYGAYESFSDIIDQLEDDDFTPTEEEWAEIRTAYQFNLDNLWEDE